MRYNLIQMKRLLLMCIACLSASFAFGQGESKLLVQVHQESGVAIPFASIEVFRGEYLKYDTQTDFLGFGTIEGIEPGSYEVEVHYSGLERKRIPLLLNAGQERAELITLSGKEGKYYKLPAKPRPLPNLGSFSYSLKNGNDYLSISIKVYCPGDDSLIASHPETAGIITFDNLIEGEYQAQITEDGYTFKRLVCVKGGVEADFGLIIEHLNIRRGHSGFRWFPRFLSGPGTSFTLTAEDIRRIPY